MKLTVPAIRAAVPDAHRQEVAEHTIELLGTIDTLLAESLAGQGLDGPGDEPQLLL